MAAVEAAKEYICGRRHLPGRPLAALLAADRRAAVRHLPRLRRLNPSPYMFFFDFGHLAGGEQPLLPHRRVAGNARAPRGPAPPPSAPSPAPARGAPPRRTTWRSKRNCSPIPKERAEHVMLVDLARNDLGRVCDYGTVHVPELMTVERYSHVMHIVSHVEGRLRAGAGRVRPGARHLPGRHGQRRAEDPRHGDHRRAGAAARAARTPGSSATSPTTARSTPASPSARSSCRARRSACRPAPASSPTRCPSANTRNR